MNEYKIAVNDFIFKIVKSIRVLFYVLFFLMVSNGYSTYVFSGDLRVNDVFNINSKNFPILLKFSIQESVFEILHNSLRMKNIDTNFLSAFKNTSMYFLLSNNYSNQFVFIDTKKSSDFLIKKVSNLINSSFKKIGDNFYSIGTSNNKGKKIKNQKVIIYPNGFVLWVAGLDKRYSNYSLIELESLFFNEGKKNAKVKNQGNHNELVKKGFDNATLFGYIRMNKLNRNMVKNSNYNIKSLLHNLKYVYIKVDFDLKNWSLNLAYSKRLNAREMVLRKFLNNKINNHFYNLLWLFENIQYKWNKNVLSLVIQFSSNDQISNLLTLGVASYMDKLGLSFLIKHFEQKFTDLS